MVTSDNNWLNTEYCHALEMHQEYFYFFHHCVEADIWEMLIPEFLW